MFQRNIDKFLQKNAYSRKPLEKIIAMFLDMCTYISGESLERHEWGNNLIKLKDDIPKDYDSESFEECILEVLKPINSTSELLWGDVQSGKRLHSMILMWFNVHILKRPVLYIFRNLKIDMKQLQDDIIGQNMNDFNNKYIKEVFDEFNSELEDEDDNEDWKQFKLPELKHINSDDAINKFSNKHSINPTDIFCCLANLAQLSKINSKFNEYIANHGELVCMTTMIDEGDLYGPSASNDNSNKFDEKNTTECEKFISKMIKKTVYTLRITGSAHTLLYNTTTKISGNKNIIINISKVHKMKRPDDYYGLLNDRIHFEVDNHDNWYKDQGKKNGDTYDIIIDYKINIKKVIEIILERPDIEYNSLLISEEKVKDKQFVLIYEIMKDFKNLFIIIFHGKCLRLYFSKDYDDELKFMSRRDSAQSKKKRLYQDGGIYGESTDKDGVAELPNNYCYYDIDLKKCTIKYVYKLLRKLFKDSKKQFPHKTIITITGKYGERGYSFTGDDYGGYSLHLTDQYLVSHGSRNCTDLSQRIRAQGRYADKELKTGQTKITLWTNRKVKDLLTCYKLFIKEIEKHIMSYNSNQEIVQFMEAKIDNGKMNYPTLLKHLAPSKHSKNIDWYSCYDSIIKANKLMICDNISNDEITEFCKQNKLPDFKCITKEPRNIGEDELNNKDKNWYAELKEEEYDSKSDDGKVPFRIVSRINSQSKESYIKKIRSYINERRVPSFKSIAVQHECVENNITYIIKDDINEKQYRGEFKPENWCFIENKNTHKCLKRNNYIICKRGDGEGYKKSEIKDEYRQQNNTHGYTNEDGEDFIEGEIKPPYYWKSPDGWLYLYNPDQKKDIYLLSILKSPLQNNNDDNDDDDNDENNIIEFIKKCCKKSDNPRLRIGIREIFTIYKEWCDENSKKSMIQKKFKEEFEKIGFKIEKSKGVSIDGSRNKRGYNIEVSL